MVCGYNNNNKIVVYLFYKKKFNLKLFTFHFSSIFRIYSVVPHT